MNDGLGKLGKLVKLGEKHRRDGSLVDNILVTGGAGCIGAQVVARPMKVEPETSHLPDRIAVLSAFSNLAKVRCVSGLGEPVSLKEGVGRMAE